MADPWLVLGVPPGSSVAQIRSAYRKRALNEHPDVCKEPGADARWLEVSEAYRLLQDPDFRRRWRARQTWKDRPKKQVEFQERREDDTQIREALFAALGKMTAEQEYAVKQAISQFDIPDTPTLDEGAHS